MNQVDLNTKELDKLLLVLNDSNNEIERMRSEIIAELKESSTELKDIIMIILNNRARSIKNTEGECINKQEAEARRELLPGATINDCHGASKRE